MMKKTVRLGIVVLSIAAGCSVQAQGYKFKALTFPEGSSNTANARNDKAQTVGSAYDQDGRAQAVVWRRGVPSVLQGLGGSGEALSINRRGQSVGYSFVPEGGVRAVQWDGTTPSILKAPRRTWTAMAVGINARGQVAGNSYRTGNWPSKAVRWVHGKPTLLDDLGRMSSVATGINGAGDVVGYVQNRSGNQSAVVWQGKAATVLESLLETRCCSQASAINEGGQIVGWSSTVDGVRAVVWEGTKPMTLQALSDADHALALNNVQQAVGMLNADGSPQAALWNLATGEGVDLNSFLTPEQRKAGWMLSYANGITDDGTIVGVVLNEKTGNFSAFELLPVSEP